jgi:hypothetical protein
MKKELMILLLMMFSLTLVVAEPCDLEVSLLNQDPYPAVPGDYVKLVFQISGVENPECGDVIFQLSEQYPIQFDAGQPNQVTIKSGTYTKDHSSSLMAPYKVRLAADALDGDNIIEVSFANSQNGVTTSAFQTQQFNLNVENVKADFEVYVKDYQAATREITFQILNIAENDIFALTVEIPEQEGVGVKGATRNIVGDLDSNDYTTTTFEATPNDGKILLNLIYTDKINERRTSQELVDFDSQYFIGRVADEKKAPIGAIITWVVVIGLIAWFVVRRILKKKKRK